MANSRDTDTAAAPDDPFVAAGSPPVHALPGEARVLEAAHRSLAREARGLRGLWPFLGPAFVAAVAYVDPGNFATNIAAGSKYGYMLLWIVLAANLMAMLIQTMSAKLGIATGRNLPEVCRDRFPRPVSRALWVQAEVIAMAHADAGVKPQEISYVETHGTATPLGDPIEVEALTLAFRPGSDDQKIRKSDSQRNPCPCSASISRCSSGRPCRSRRRRPSSTRSTRPRWPPASCCAASRTRSRRA